MRLEDVDNKKEVLQPFFEWLFDDDRITDKSVTLFDEIDYTLASSYSDSNIYYPKQIKDFFETEAMRRLGRVSQLDLAINYHPNLYHTRLEHSKGVYNRKVEELFYKFQEPKWKKYIEANNLKLYLVAELLKMAGHDIGHLPLSHAFEDQVCKKRGMHEEIGKRLMLEDKEIQNVFHSISPYLSNVINELYENDILNFKEHDESSYDVDRLDYLNRDSLYLGFKTELPTITYNSVCVNISKDNIPKRNKDNSISESTNGESYIDVYDFSNLKDIEESLLLREKRYTNLYVSSLVQSNESSISNFLNIFSYMNSEYGKNLRDYLTDLRTKDSKDLDLNKFKHFDEITLYSELIDVAEHAENDTFQDLAALIIPNMSALLTLTYSYLNMHDKKQTYSEYDKNFLRKLKGLIKSDSSLANKLKDKNYITNNIIFLPEDTPFLDSSEKELINTYDWSIRSYKKKEPIYIRDVNGKIFELSEHPNRSCDWDKREIPLHYSYVHIPNLRYNGVSEDLIDKLKRFYGTSSSNIGVNKEKTHIDVNMQPLQVGHNIEDCFLEL